MDKELIEKCRLTEQEKLACSLPSKYCLESVRDVITETQEFVLEKAIPIISAQKDIECQQRVEEAKTRLRAQAPNLIAEAKKQERERIEKEFIWGQVPYLDEVGNIKEWTMRCISDKDWQALKGEGK